MRGEHQYSHWCSTAETRFWWRLSLFALRYTPHLDGLLEEQRWSAASARGGTQSSPHTGKGDDREALVRRARRTMEVTCRVRQNRLRQRKRRGARLELHRLGVCLNFPILWILMEPTPLGGPSPAIPLSWMKVPCQDAAQTPAGTDPTWLR